MQEKTVRDGLFVCVLRGEVKLPGNTKRRLRNRKAVVLKRNGEIDMKLSERLELVLSFVEPGESAADVGTDHGHVPVELVRRTIVKKAVAMDVRKGPLSRATENIALAGLADKIETRLSDGVAKLLPGEADSVVIAGMGGELIIKILENGRHMWDPVKQWVLSPQSEIFKVRRWLFENGFVIRKEDMVLEDGKFYTVMDVRREKDADSEGKTVDPDVLSLSEDSRMLYGDYLIRTKNPVLLTYLKEEEAKLLRFIEDLSAKAGDSERAAERLSELKLQLKENQEVQHEMQGDH